MRNKAIGSASAKRLEKANAQCHLTNELSGPRAAAQSARRAHTFFGARRALCFIAHGPFQRMLGRQFIRFPTNPIAEVEGSSAAQANAGYYPYPPVPK